MGSALRFGMLVASALPALASPFLEERAGKCNRDNLLRCYDPTGTISANIASRSAATSFCSSYLSIPVVTSVVATSTPVTTVTSTITTTDATEVQTSISTSVIVQTSTTTQTLPYPVLGQQKRDYVSTVAAPACAATTYVPSAVSSACSCLSIVPSTTYVTATVETSTSVIPQTVHETTTTTTETTKTDAQTTTVTVQTTGPSPTCTGETTTASNGKVYCVVRNAYDNSQTWNIVGWPNTTPTLESCMELCVPLPGCIGINWFHDGNTCEALYDSSGGIQTGTDWLDTAYLPESVPENLR